MPSCNFLKIEDTSCNISDAVELPEVQICDCWVSSQVDLNFDYCKIIFVH